MLNACSRIRFARRLMVLAMFLSCLCAGALGQSAHLTGTLNIPNASGFNGVLYLSLLQQAAISSGLNLDGASCGGPVQVVPVEQVAIKVVNGVLSSPPALYGSDCTLPFGIPYDVRLVDAQGNTALHDYWSLMHTTIDVGTIVSVNSPTIAASVLVMPYGAFDINSGSGADIGAKFNFIKTNYCTGGQKCKVQVGPGYYDFTTTMAWASNITLECTSPYATTLHYSGSDWAMTGTNINDWEIRNCGLAMTGSAKGFVKAQYPQHGIWTSLHLDGAAASTSAVWFRLTGDRAHYGSINFFSSITGSAMNGRTFWLDHIVDTFFNQIDLYGSPDGTTGRQLICDTECDGTQITDFSGGYSGKYGLWVTNTLNLTTLTGNVSAGSNVTIPVADSSVCTGYNLGNDKAAIGYTGQTHEWPVVTQIVDATHVKVASLSNGYSNGTVFSCGYAPIWIFAKAMISDCSDGGETWLFDKSLDAGAAGVEGVGYTFDASWAAGAGVNCSNNSIANSNLAGVRIDGGAFMQFTSSKFRYNTGPAFLITADGSLEREIIISQNQLSGNNQGNNADQAAIEIDTARNIIITANRINNYFDGGHQKHAMAIRNSAQGAIIFTDNICNNETDCYISAMSAPGLIATGNVDLAHLSTPPTNHLQGPLELASNSGIDNLWLMVNGSAANNYQTGICQNIHFDYASGNWISPPNGVNNGGTCLLGFNQGIANIYTIPSTGNTTQTLTEAQFEQYKAGTFQATSTTAGYFQVIPNLGFTYNSTQGIVTLGASGDYSLLDKATHNWNLYLNSASRLYCDVASNACGPNAGVAWKVGSGATVVYRCTAAGTLPIGALTTVAGNCGTSVATSLFVN